MWKIGISLLGLALVALGLVAWNLPSDQPVQSAGPKQLAADEATQATPLSLAKLPAAGYVSLAPGDATALDKLGLGGPSPVSEPPSYPYSASGIYWSQRFSLVEGDTLRLWVLSPEPLSWFGVDWSPLSVRGVLASTELDEDGRTFNPLYPSRWSSQLDNAGTLLSLEWDMPGDTECALVVKNSDPARTQRVTILVEDHSPFTLKRVLRTVPLIGGLFDLEEIEPY
jgi:hypothetical protein